MLNDAVAEQQEEDMTPEEINRIALENTPDVNIIRHDDFFRHDVLSMVNGDDCIGIELGVAGGDFSRRMIDSNKFRKFFGVDLYEDHHNVVEYKNALKLIGLEKNYVLLRMSFDEACDLFDDDYFDFIYFDGYAHTGEEGGKTFVDWYKKLKIGGVFAGDDYHERWPLVVWAVNHIVSQIGCDLHVTGQTEITNLNRYPSWFFVKQGHVDFSPSDELLKLGSEIMAETRKKLSHIKMSIEDIANLLIQVRARNPAAAEELKKLL